MLELAAHNNIPTGIVVHSCCATPKPRKVAVILVNATNSNIRIWKSLLAVKMYEAEIELWHYYIKMDQKGEDIKITFWPISPPEIELELKVNHVEEAIKADEQENKYG